jgi:hypothetical protein
MTPSEELELKIFHFADAQGKGEWRPTHPGMLAQAVQSSLNVLVGALAHLQAQRFIEFREWRSEQNRSVPYAVESHDCFYRPFDMTVAFEGRKYFERLEAQAAELSRVDRMPVARLLEMAGHQASLRELKEAHSDLVKRPDPDLTGVVQHCMAALECTAKLIAGAKAGTLHEVLKSRKLNLPLHLSEMLDKAWGFSSERGRHVKEGKPISYPDAELMLNLCEAMIVYLFRSQQDRGETV